MPMSGMNSSKICEDLDTSIGNYACKYLQKRYDREFEITNIRKYMAISDTLELTINPKDDKKFNFCIKINTDGEIQEQYIKNLLLQRFNVSLQNYFAVYDINCAVNSDILSAKDIGETDQKLSMQDIIKKYEIDEIYATAIFKFSDIKSQPADIVNIIKDYSKSKNINVHIVGDILEDNYFEACKKNCFEKWSYVSEIVVRDEYKSKLDFIIVVTDGVLVKETLTKRIGNI